MGVEKRHRGRGRLWWHAVGFVAVAQGSKHGTRQIALIHSGRNSSGKTVLPITHSIAGWLLCDIQPCHKLLL